MKLLGMMRWRWMIMIEIGWIKARSTLVVDRDDGEIYPLRADRDNAKFSIKNTLHIDSNVIGILEG